MIPRFLVLCFILMSWSLLAKEIPMTEDQILKKELELNQTLIVGEKVEVTDLVEGPEPRIAYSDPQKNENDEEETDSNLQKNTVETEIAEQESLVGNKAEGSFASPTTEPIHQLEMEYEEDTSGQKFYAVDFRYLGVMTQVGFETRFYRQFSVGLHYGRFQGKVAGTDKLGMVPDLHQVALGVNAYLGREKIAFTNGPIIRFGLTYNQQKANNLVQSVQVDGKDVIRPGESKVGTQLGIGYHYQFKNLFANAGIEYITLGALKNLVPIAVTVGVAF